MITLTRLTGAPFALNPDLVERVDCTPDTVITLVDGTKYLVSESLHEVADIILGYRASIVAMAGSYASRDTSEPRRPRLSSVPTNTDESPVDADHADHAGYADDIDDADDAADAASAAPATFEPRSL